MPTIGIGHRISVDLPYGVERLSSVAFIGRHRAGSCVRFAPTLKRIASARRFRRGECQWLIVSFGRSRWRSRSTVRVVSDTI